MTSQSANNRVSSRPVSTHVLIADSDAVTVRTLLELFARLGIRGSVANDAKQAVRYLDKNDCDLVFCGVRADRPKAGFELFRYIRLNSPELPVVMIGEGDRAGILMLETAIRAIQVGCCDFLTKPLDIEKVVVLLDKLVPAQAVATAECAGQHRIIGGGRGLEANDHAGEKVAPTSVPVLVCGESGSGKELIASLIHDHSRRVDGPYMQVNCAALNDSGCWKANCSDMKRVPLPALTVSGKVGLSVPMVERQPLDEITETPIPFQAKLLRVLEQQDFERVGGNDTVRVDVRIISTTNKNMADEVAAGHFRQDLYYRLCGVKLAVPSLAQRVDDLPDLVWHFVNQYAKQAQRQVTDLSPEMMTIFSQYHWPGNIRQLRNVVRTALILGNGPTLSLADTSWLFDELQPRPQQAAVLVDSDRVCQGGLSGLPLAEVERQAILDTLEQTDGNQAKAARILGISDRTLRGKVRQYHQQDDLQPA